MPVAEPAARWIVGERNREAEEALRRELGIPAIVAAVLAQRGYTDPAKAHVFLNPSLDQLHDPASLPDYAAARDAILGAKERQELIYVHGDYDVDGVTSAAILSRFLRAVGCKVHTHVPHRMKEGYGIHRSAVEAAQAAGAKLFLTCDCGVGAHEQVEMAKAAGMTVVVTDHHSIGGSLPDAAAVINPHRTDSAYPFAELSGAGVVFKLCEGLAKELGLPLNQYYQRYLDLAALGTIADVMPLVGENRIIARFGLQCLPQTRKAGLQALMKEAKVSVDAGKPLRSYHVGFVLGPRLNAAGRLDDAAIALRLLLENDDEAACELARQIEEVNTARRAEQQRIIDEAVEKVLSTGAHNRNVIVVGNQGWHAGVVGIVAGRLVEQFRRPTFVMTIDDKGVAKGSARTIPNFHLADAIRAHSDLFLSGGGHAMAAGCSFEAERIGEVQNALHDYASGFLTEEDFVPAVRADMELSPDEVTLQAVEALSQMEPFGCENPEPLFVARDITLSQVLPTKNPAHARLLLRAGRSPAVPGIAFGIGERLANTGAGVVADLLFQPTVEEWKGMRSLKWQVKDYAVA
jgi:single-stranded-DNA-specific exonuclease